ncbi:glycosyltransferase family 4 protein [Pseudonocardia asaccharolytica]|uniref:LPS biosynthesis rfbu related protein n=1 Tax=Pseudonocardia asaccharolytica DSM 44247 = NBRC 16224 TaxID=1123024 RepID=A0A511CWG5_9PSEU|nr:glycosyltransferase family 4 protein [Pseudonocardia asaccharolytica]GEL16910.1 LPS biosynthesis rfbu related protein [Pseudonocardia asaccharolytica DSM 44247 = NBRC 16224]
MTRPTVAVVAPFYPPHIGGAERYAERIAHELRDSPDLEPVVITAAPGRRTEVETRDGVVVVRLARWFTVSNTPVNPLWWWNIRRILRRYRVAVINTHAPVAFLADVATLVAGRRPVVQTYHAGSMVKHTGHLDRLISGYEKHLLPRVFRRADVLVAVSPTSLAHAVPGSLVIPPGVDTTVFTPAHHPWGDTLLYVGRIDRSSAWKGVDVLIRAFAVVVRQHPRALLRIVGVGDALDDHRKLAESLGVADHVEFAGLLAVEDLVDAYQRARTVILPSRTESESFGMALVEAMACARPVIGSRVGGIPTVIDEGRTGLLVPPGDAGSLAEACLRLLTDDEMCARLGMAGRHHVEHAYAWPGLVDRYLDTFRGLLPGAAAATSRRVRAGSRPT